MKVRIAVLLLALLAPVIAYPQEAVEQAVDPEQLRAELDAWKARYADLTVQCSDQLDRYNQARLFNAQVAQRLHEELTAIIAAYDAGEDIGEQIKAAKTLTGYEAPAGQEEGQ